MGITTQTEKHVFIKGILEKDGRSLECALSVVKLTFHGSIEKTIDKRVAIYDAPHYQAAGTYTLSYEGKTGSAEHDGNVEWTIRS